MNKEKKSQLNKYFILKKENGFLYGVFFLADVTVMFLVCTWIVSDLELPIIDKCLNNNISSFNYRVLYV
jgi:hypothetical protein